MPGQLRNLKRRKGRSSSEAKRSSKASAARRKDIKRPKMNPAASLHQSSSLAPLERLSRISCECHHHPDGRRCSASPPLEEQEGKENEVRMRLEVDGCRAVEEMDDGGAGKTMFPDDDSNQILPVEQFFGNLDAVQDCPQRSSTSSVWVRSKNRRRHYYAREDSDEEAEAVVAGDDGGAS